MEKIVYVVVYVVVTLGTQALCLWAGWNLFVVFVFPTMPKLTFFAALGLAVLVYAIIRPAKIEVK